jgi:hypothetical protein
MKRNFFYQEADFSFIFILEAGKSRVKSQLFNFLLTSLTYQITPF